MFGEERRDDNLLGRVFEEGVKLFREVGRGVDFNSRVVGLTDIQKDDLLILIQLMQKEDLQDLSNDLLNQAEEVLGKYLSLVDQVKEQRHLDDQDEMWF